MRIGFTGTQWGMTLRQKAAFRIELEHYGNVITTFAHGDCIGADADAHEIALDVLGAERIEIYPPDIDTKRAFCVTAGFVDVPRPYLDRNKEIVLRTQILIAAPGEKLEKLRSGTWSTVRYARKLNRIVLILEP